MFKNDYGSKSERPNVGHVLERRGEENGEKKVYSIEAIAVENCRRSDAQKFTD